VNSGGLGNTRIFSQCAGSVLRICTDTTSATEHTQCFLVEKGHLATMANCQHPTRIIYRDTVDGAVKRVCPHFMFRSALLGGLRLIITRATVMEQGLTKSLSPIWTVSMAPLANPQTTVIGNVGSHRSAVTGETFTSFFATSQDVVAVTRTTPFSQPLARYSPSGEKRRTVTELVCPESVSALSYL